ncbi:MAG: prolyl oligopeptidase family serine peptidase [Herpetosiphon sp.]
MIRFDSPDRLQDEHIIVDPVQLNPDGTTAIDFYVPSADGRLVAVSLSEQGSEAGTLHIYEVATGREVGDIIPNINFPTAGGSVAWNEDGSGFYYTRYPRVGERAPEDLHFYQQIYFHRLGDDPDADSYVLGRDFPRIAEIDLHTSRDGRYVLAIVSNGDGGEHAHYVRLLDGTWVQLTTFADQYTAAALGDDDSVYLLGHHDAPRGKVVRIPLGTPALAHAQTLVPEGSLSIQSFKTAQDQLYVVEMDGGPSTIHVYDRHGVDRGTVPGAPVSAVQQVVALGVGHILYRTTSFVAPPAWYRFDPTDEEPVRTRLSVTPAESFDDAEVVREMVTSPDGTQVPITLIRRRGQTNGAAPTMLYGYGGYGLSLSPSFQITRRLWLDQGGIWVVANLRGGGEFGEAWHRAGYLVHKQRVFDDFIACAEHLIARGYTSREKLVIQGGSNGGLLMGAALTQRPELFRGVVSHVGIYDMLRVELDPNGAFNVTEFGSVQDHDQFKALYAYSPYHRVVEGTRYPAVMFVTGEHDGRVNPAHSRKMTARLQAATGSELPVLLRTDPHTGHGMGSALKYRIAGDADVYTFLFTLLGLSLSE